MRNSFGGTKTIGYSEKKRKGEDKKGGEEGNGEEALNSQGIL